MSVLFTSNDAHNAIVDTELSERDLRSLYAIPSKPFVRANMVTTLDGAITGNDGTSTSLSGPADRAVFRVIRSLADVIVVGAHTAAAEEYTRIVLSDELQQARISEGMTALPQLAVVTTLDELPDALLDSQWAPLVICPDDAPVLNALTQHIGPERIVLAGSDGHVDLSAALQALNDRGLMSVLCEGGPHMLGSLIEARLLNELALTLAPLVVGGDAPRLIAADELRQGMNMRHLLKSGNELLSLWSVEGG